MIGVELISCAWSNHQQKYKFVSIFSPEGPFGTLLLANKLMKQIFRVSTLRPMFIDKILFRRFRLGKNTCPKQP